MSTRGKPKVPDLLLFKLYTEGWTFRKIGEKYDVSFQSLAQQFKRCGGTARPNHVRLYSPIPCATCGTMFTPDKKSHRYCSQDCVPGKDVMRQTHCKRGHVLTPDNLYPRYKKTPPRCKKCVRENQREYHRRKKEQEHGR